VILLSAAARGLVDPAGQALLPFLVSFDRLPIAISRASSLREISVIVGPALGGFMAACGPGTPYGVCSAASLAAALGVATLRWRSGKPTSVATLRMSIQRVRDGVLFVCSHPVVFGAVSLDLSAVLLGGAVALLPVYARDVLHVGSIGLGLLRSTPAAGACGMALYHARHPIRRHLGLKLFAAVAVFGMATIIFGLSTWFPLSLAALFVLGASDIISVNIRSLLIHLATPDAMRGRVASVNMLFIGASSELGQFESGLTAAIVGTVPAVILGGIATLAVIPIWMKLFPRLTREDRLSIRQEADEPSNNDMQGCVLVGERPC
jgi:hypothetical protein